MTCVIFDCDGVLIDSEYFYAKSEVDQLKETFGWDDTPQEHNKKYCGLGLKAFYEILEQKSGAPLPEGFIEKLIARKQKIFASELVSIPGVEAMVNALRVPYCVASNTEKSFLDFCLQQTKLYDLFAPHIYSAVGIGAGKPAPDVFLHAAERMNAKPEDCIVIEDSHHGVTAARAAGMRVIGFTGGNHCYTGYAEERLGEADQIVHTMDELRRVLVA